MSQSAWSTVVVLLLVGVSCLAAVAQTPENTAQVEVDVTRPSGATIPRTIFGSFLEPIGRSIQGGLSAEILENPSFEDYLSSAGAIRRMTDRNPALNRASEIGLPLPWQPLHDDQGWRYEPRFGDAYNSFRSLFVMALPDAETGVRQEVFLPVHRTTKYVGWFYAKYQSGDRHVEVSFRKRDEAAVVHCRSTVEMKGEGWTKYGFTLELPAGAVAPLQPADFVIVLKNGGRASLDQVMLYPADHVDYMDPDVLALCKDMKTTVIRYGGNFTSGYHWKDGMGPLDKRVSMINQSWGFPEYNHFGTDEFLRLCELVGAQPQIAVNLGSGTPHEAAEWVAYVSRKWGDRNGGALWELGNELWGAGWQIGYPAFSELEPRTGAFSKAIREVDPKARLIATGADPDNFRGWNAELMKLPPETFQLFATHFVDGVGDVRKPNATNNFVTLSGFALPIGLERHLKEMNAQFEADPRWKGRAQIAFSEWLFHGPADRVPSFTNMGGAVIVGGLLNTFLRNTDIVPVSTMTGLMDFHGIHKAKGQAFGTPSYWAFRMYASAGAARVAPATVKVAQYDVEEGNTRIPNIPNVPYLDVVAALDESGETLVLFCVNRRIDGPISATISVAGFTGPGKAQTLSSERITDSNNEEHPEAVKPVETDARPAGGKLEFQFPPASVTVIRLKKG
ncbi:MAG TPA: alpha-L-arabinofuranosidase C-terminal domain-containing protein [Armatimonadota bacterium]|jgi:alpha-N-arabinofuranosidase